MVKFGGHVEAIREGDLVDAQLYLVPYNNMKILIHENGNDVPTDGMLKAKLLQSVGLVYDGAEQKVAEDDTSEEELFIAVWTKGLKDADEDFHKARGEIWQKLFAEIAASGDDENMVRGAHPGNAIKLYVDLMHDKGGNEAQELLSQMKLVYRAATVNSEALRKIVKKFDKHRQGRELSSKLLPLLYTSSLYSGQNMISDSIGLLRELIDGDYDELSIAADDDEDKYMKGERPFKSLVRQNSEMRHLESRDVRMMEFNWLKSLVRSIPQVDLLPKLVAHRGFHNTKDRNDKRPVENSLSAYEMAWTCGIELCECDIALTKDEKLVLAHDEDFARLSLDTEGANSKRKVGDLTFREIISMPLANGARPPLLIDVLRSASAISEKSKLVIEIKPGNDASAFALARLLTRHPDLRSSVAMIMSFDAATMHRLRAELARLMPPDISDLADENQGMPLKMHKRMNSYDHFGTMSTNFLGMSTANFGMSTANFGMSTANFRSSVHKLPTIDARRESAPGKRESLDLAAIGLSISDTNMQNQVQEDSFDTFGNPPPRNDMPKLMLLTVAQTPNIACELQVQYNELHRVDNWLRQDDGSLDGVYLQYEKEMVTDEGAAYLRQLSQRFMVGIWGYANKDPDDFETFSRLVKDGNCTFVNTDLPKDFRKEIDLVMHTGN